MRRVAKPKLGTKRICPNCGTRYYDLEKDPIICPKCGTRFEAPTRGRAQPVAAVVEKEVEEQVKLGLKFMKEYRDTFRALAK